MNLELRTSGVPHLRLTIQAPRPVSVFHAIVTSESQAPVHVSDRSLTRPPLCRVSSLSGLTFL